MANKLKVFSWSDGFHAFTVAVSSRPKALEAWGSKQDLFASGLARELRDGPDYKAAMAAPGEVIARGLAVDVGKIARISPRKADAGSKSRRARIEALEREVEALDGEHADALEKVDEEARRLQAHRSALSDDYDRRRKALVAKLKAARAK
jgi:hypothetical protein